MLFSVSTYAVFILFDYFQGIYILIQIVIALFSSNVLPFIVLKRWKNES